MYISPCPSTLYSDKTILVDENIRKKFKDYLIKIKKEALQKVQELEGDINEIKYKYPFQYFLFSELSCTFRVQRSLITTLGSTWIPNLLKILVEGRGFIAELNYQLKMKLPVEIINKIDEIVNDLDSRKRQPNIEEELKDLITLLSNPSTNLKIVNITADLFIKHPNDLKYSYYIELKTPQPKKEDCVRSKRRLLLFRIYKYLMLIKSGMNSQQAFKEALSSAFIGFYYNPFNYTTEQIRKAGRYPHTFVNGIFELKELVIAEELWDCLGGNGTYQELIKMIDEVLIELGKGKNQ